MSELVVVAWAQVLLNSLWQGLVLGALVSVASRWMPDSMAAQRYVLRWAALATLCVMAGYQFAGAVRGHVVSAPLLAPLHSEVAVFRGSAGAAVAPQGLRHPVETDVAESPTSDGNSPSSLSVGRVVSWARSAERGLEEVTRVAWRPEGGTVGIAVAMFAVVLWRLMRVMTSYVSVERMKGRARAYRAPMESMGGRRCEVRESDELTVPALAGLLRPAILLPAGMVAHGTAEELRVAVLHESAHLDRWDDWTQLAQRVLEAVLFWHVGVRWMTAGMDLDREQACDVWVLRRTGDRRGYAECLARAAASGPGLATTAMTGQGKTILKRLEAIMTVQIGERGTWKRPVSVGAALAAVGGVLAAMGPLVLLEMPVVMRAQTAAESEAPRVGQRPSPMPAPNTPRAVRRAEAEAQGLRLVTPVAPVAAPEPTRRPAPRDGAVMAVPAPAPLPPLPPSGVLAQAPPAPALPPAPAVAQAPAAQQRNLRVERERAGSEAQAQRQLEQAERQLAIARQALERARAEAERGRAERQVAERGAAERRAVERRLVERGAVERRAAVEAGSEQARALQEVTRTLREQARELASQIQRIEAEELPRLEREIRRIEEETRGR